MEKLLDPVKTQKAGQYPNGMPTDEYLPVQPEAHRCLFIPELLIHVFGLLVRGDIISASLVCKAWHEWALPASWSVHPVSFKQLLKVLRAKPVMIGSMWGTRLTLRPSPNLTIPDDVTFDEWSQFLYGFRQIRTLFGGRLEGIEELMKRIGDLQRLYGGELVPNFQRITSYSDALLDSKVLPGVFFSSQLRSISLHQPLGTRGDEETTTGKLDALLTRLENKAPYIEEISIVASSLAFSSFDTFTNLKKFAHEGAISYHALKSIFRCHTLRRLSLIRSRLLNNLTGLEPIKHVGLQEADIGISSYPGPQAEDGLFKILALPRLRKLSMMDELGHSDRIISAIEYFCEKSPEVCEVSLSVWYPITDTIFSCLCGFSGLKELTIVMGRNGQYILDDSELKRCLKNMPFLEVFEWNRTSSDGNAYMKLGPLLCFAYNSPKLKKLSLPLDSTVLHKQLGDVMADEQESIEQGDAPFPVLCALTLWVLNLARSNIALLARTLVRLTPDTARLRILLQNEGNYGPPVEIWSPGNTESPSTEARLHALIDGLRQEKY